VAIVSNAGAAGVLAADACTDSGLAVARLGQATQSALRGLLPAGAAVTGPVDTTPGVTTEAFRACLEQAAADDGVDAVLAVAVPTALSDLRTALTTAGLAKPVAAALLGQSEGVRLLRRGGPDEPVFATPQSPALAAVPAYAYPEGAARALGHAARYQAWRGRQEAPAAPPAGLRVADARRLTAAGLERDPGGGWLPPAQAAELAACYQIPVGSGGEAGTEVRAGIVQEPVFGPLVRFGPGGTAAEALGGDTTRLAPLSPADADDLITESAAAPLLGDSTDTAALAGLLLRLSRLADDLPEVAELELSPLIAGPGGARAAAVKVRLSPADRPDPFLRRLR
jgi:acyl-CoA synthetase (NDP forming)